METVLGLGVCSIIFGLFYLFVQKKGKIEHPNCKH